MALNDLEYARALAIPRTPENMAMIRRVRIAGDYLRHRALQRYQQAEARFADCGGTPYNTPHQLQYGDATRRIVHFEARALRKRCGELRQRKEQLLVALRSKSPLRPQEGTTQPVDGLALFDHARSPAMI